MKRMVWYARGCLAACIVCAVSLVTALIRQPLYWNWFVVISLTTGLIAAFLFFSVCKKLAQARLIVENQILHIQPAVFREWDSRDEFGTRPCETVEMFVSCFGILLGSKVIKFNQEGIQLKAVEIGPNYLSIDYGTNIDIQNIRLIYVRPESEGLAQIISKFRYETGIVPVVIQ